MQIKWFRFVCWDLMFRGGGLGKRVTTKVRGQVEVGNGAGQQAEREIRKHGGLGILQETQDGAGRLGPRCAGSGLGWLGRVGRKSQSSSPPPPTLRMGGKKGDETRGGRGGNRRPPSSCSSSRLSQKAALVPKHAHAAPPALALLPAILRHLTLRRW